MSEPDLVGAIKAGRESWVLCGCVGECTWTAWIQWERNEGIGGGDNPRQDQLLYQDLY